MEKSRFDMDTRGEDRKSFDPLKKRSGESGDGRRGRSEYVHRVERGEQRSNPEKEGGRPRGEGASRGSALSALMDIDADILHLVIRRAQMLSRLRGGGRLAPEKEKALRTAWEGKAARLSRDSRLSRDLFVLLQTIEPLTRAEEEQGYYNLAPSREPADIRLPAPSDTVEARAWLAVAAAAGQVTRLSRVPLTDAVTSCVKALNQIGGQLWWEDNGDVQSRGGQGLVRGMDKIVHVGDDPFNLWLVIALCMGMPSRLKLTGDSSLRFLNLAPLRHFLPRMGVRMTNVIPAQDGLPVRLECSGLVPGEADLPEDLPEDFVAALVLASPFWDTPCTLKLPEHAPRLLPMVLEVLGGCGLGVRHEGREICVAQGNISLPEQPVLPMEASVAASLLMIPGFVGGSAVLYGTWGKGAAFSLAENLLKDAGLDVTYGEQQISCAGRKEKARVPSAETMAEAAAERQELLPLCAVIMASAVHEGAAVSLPELPEEDSHVLTAFLARCGVEESEGGLSLSDQTVSGSWVAPTAQWAMAYALGAFLKPQLHLSNPGVMTRLFPLFWNMYNTLPCPELRRRVEQENTEHVRPARRRVIARGVYGELPPEPASGEDF